MRYTIPTTRGLKTIEDDVQQCWVVWHHEGEAYNEFTGSEKECKEYIESRPHKEDYEIRYSEYDF